MRPVLAERLELVADELTRRRRARGSRRSPGRGTPRGSSARRGRKHGIDARRESRQVRGRVQLDGLVALPRARSRRRRCTRTAICARVKPSGKTIRNGFGGDGGRRSAAACEWCTCGKATTTATTTAMTAPTLAVERHDAPTADLLTRRPAGPPSRLSVGRSATRGSSTADVRPRVRRRRRRAPT